MTRNPDPIDIHVGQKLRLLRKVEGRTQSMVASGLGISFQQVQKYEKGTSRIAAGRLYRLATLLEVPVAYFYDGLPAKIQTKAAGRSKDSRSSRGRDLVAALYDERAVLRLVNAYLQITDEQVRAALVATAESMARSLAPRSRS